MRKVPKLRFKEFTDEWEEKNILELCSMKARIGWQNLRKEEHLDKGEFYLITGTDFYLDKIKWDTAKFVEEERYLQDINIILKEGDILITKDGSIGKLAFVENIGNKKATLNNGIFRIRIEKENHYSKYFYYTFFSKRFKNFLQQLTAGSTIVHLYQKDFEKYKIAYSSFKEQQKIANFLSSIDKKISLTEEKLELFREYKKGVMQKIFSQELRFKDSDGDDYPEWEDKRLGEIGEIIGGGTPPSGVIEYWNGNIQWFTPSEIGKNKYVNKSLRTITEIGLKNSSAKLLPKGTILLSSRATIGEKSIALEKVTTNQGFQSIFVNEKNYNEFIYYLLDYIKPELIKKATGSTFLEIGAKSLKEISTKLPTLEEQQKIANFLSSIDSKIENIEKELERLKEFKKGLLQQMFV